MNAVTKGVVTNAVALLFINVLWYALNMASTPTLFSAIDRTAYQWIALGVFWIGWKRRWSE